MKDKIKAALQQEYPHLGLDDETFEGVASAAETLVKEEADIPNFVKGAEKMLKRYQSIADKARGEAAESKKALEELKKKMEDASKKNDDKPDDPKDKPKDQPDFAKMVADAVTAAVKPLQDKIDAFEAEGTKKNAIKEGKDIFFANKLAGEYTSERDEAWDRAIEVNELSGSKMSGSELAEKAKTYFDKAVSRKGVDTKKAYDSNGDQKPVYEGDKRIAEKLRGGNNKNN